MTEIVLPNDNWQPRPYQRPAWDYLERGGKRAVLVHHRRAGKDEVALHYTAVAAMQKPGNYWHMLPEFSHGRRALWEAVNPHTGKKRIDEAFPPEIRKGKANETGMRIELRSGSVWHIVGSDNYDALVGSPPVGVVFSEWALANPAAWAFIEPILEENGGWAIFPYTPRGNNHGKKMYDHALKTEGWFGQLLKASQTGVFNPEQLERIRQGLVDLYGDTEGGALFKQEYDCSWEGCIPGAYYTKQMAEARAEGRIGNVPWDRSIEVDTFWDLGLNDAMSIWFIQQVGKEFRVIDYEEGTGYGFEHYAKILKEKPYAYGNHYMPHDAEARELSSGEIARSRREVAEGLGIRPIEVVQRAKNMDIIINVHIPAVRMVFPFCRFDEVKCARGLSGLEGYHAKHDEVNKTLMNRPAHTWESNPADAFRTFAVGYTERLRTVRSKQSVTEAEEWDPLNC